MGASLIVSLILGVLGIAASVGGVAANAAQNRDNLDTQRGINEDNWNHQQQVNASNVAQQALVNSQNSISGQVASLQRMGYSRAGALQALNGSQGQQQAAQLSSADGSMTSAQPLDFSQLAGSLASVSSNVQQAGEFSANKRLAEERLKVQQREVAVKESENLRKQAQFDYDKKAKVAADTMISKLSPLVQGSNLTDWTDLYSWIESNEELRNSSAWRDVLRNSGAREILQNWFANLQSSSAATAQNKIIWNQASRIGFYNSMEELDKIEKMLRNQHLLQDLEHNAQMYPLVRMFQQGKIQALYQEIETNYLRRNKELTALDLQNLLMQCNIDKVQLDTAIRAADNRASLRANDKFENGNSREKAYIDFLDFVSTTLQPIKGVLRIIPQ